MNEKIKVVLADDHRSYVEGLTALFRDDDRVNFCGFVHLPADVPAAVEKWLPDVVLMDYSFGENEPDGIEVSEQLLQRFPRLKIIMLTSYDDIPLVETALGKGLCGYLLKTRSRLELKVAIEAAAAGFEIVEQGVMKKIFDKGFREGRKTKDVDAGAAHPLTTRELEIALLIADGLSTRAIADRLFISTNTVDTHRKNIFSKVGVHKETELVNWLRQRGLV
mgnify:CR=1 FL=1